MAGERQQKNFTADAARALAHFGDSSEQACPFRASSARKSAGDSQVYHELQPASPSRRYFARLLPCYAPAHNAHLIDDFHALDASAAATGRRYDYTLNGDGDALLLPSRPSARSR